MLHSEDFERLKASFPPDSGWTEREFDEKSKSPEGSMIGWHQSLFFPAIIINLLSFAASQT